MKNITRLFGFLAAAAIIAVVPANAQVLPVGDDSSVEVDLGFTFSICGGHYDSVWVNGNGNLTFGSGDSDFTESAGDLLGDARPRIAGLWDDLHPGNGGTVSAAITPNSATILYDGVPEWSNTGSNTFSITLTANSNKIDIDIGEIDATDGLIGVSCGGAHAIGNEAGTDVSEDAGGNVGLRNATAYYELFSFSNPNDTENTSYSFSAPNGFNDSAEPNNTLGNAKSVQLPYNSGELQGNSGGEYTAIAESQEPVLRRRLLQVQRDRRDDAHRRDHQRRDRQPDRPVRRVDGRPARHRRRRRRRPVVEAGLHDPGGRPVRPRRDHFPGLRLRRRRDEPRTLRAGHVRVRRRAALPR